LWETVRRLAAPGAPVYVMDLVRPGSVSEAERLVEMYAAGEPEVLRRDFYNSLLAAFSLEEIEGQLEHAQLPHLEVKAVSDRHVLIAGRV
ncbi:MAG TPA: SAM-dependent methyltransferase, partial [Candidatus Eisenbacteria bacterium]|nr:SAM-dependent methyltransferase [Candidatus Eisenbacteria bacterium]